MRMRKTLTSCRKESLSRRFIIDKRFPYFPFNKISFSSKCRKLLLFLCKNLTYNRKVSRILLIFTINTIKSKKIKTMKKRDTVDKKE